ncbi:hypothetical protein HYW76_02945 [Candidatus Pacearchaeota archaeon]|nr:hypothetical protein [Candidatus Pacearchaeota archaeon]
MEIILDTNFIIECIKEKIEFSCLEDFGTLIIPEEVIEELKTMANEETLKNRSLAILAIQIIEKNKEKLKFLSLHTGYVDAGITEYVKHNKNTAVATLDKGLKSRVRGHAKILIIQARKKVMLE